MNEMIDKEKAIRDIAIMLAIIVAAAGMFSIFLLTPAQGQFREMILAIINIIAKSVTSNDVSAALTAVKLGWWKALIIVLCAYVLYWTIRNMKLTKEMLATLFGLRHTAHKGIENLKYVSKKGKMNTLKDEKEKHLHSLEAKEQSSYPMDKENMKKLIVDALSKILKKEEDYTIKEVMVEIEKKHSMGLHEKRHWIEVIQEVIKSNKEYALKKKSIV